MPDHSLCYFCASGVSYVTLFIGNEDIMFKVRLLFATYCLDEGLQKTRPLVIMRKHANRRTYTPCVQAVVCNSGTGTARHVWRVVGTRPVTTTFLAAMRSDCTCSCDTVFRP